ncbi:hypothetical protein EZJ43_13285 [Pedobacter changchengzhani]|uniref:Uncharacterized protein n=1 Tax=Pedobacter changchengzhani TaxID=2529274 RepID=A0A4R5MKH1_9SPHI|nr:hypothetical protein [Pedobacter changchengzhani]TDG35589.1 hypothetical protein EZJ43_13285 [Pedobacter changchengzhani]
MSHSGFAQDEFDIIRIYKKALVKSDSLLANGDISEINLDELMTVTNKLNNQHPSGYVDQALKYFKESRFNESGFLYNLAKMRLVDWNKNNVGVYYDFYGDQKVELEEGVFLYLAADIDNYKKVLELALKYYRENDYLFISKKPGYHKAEISEDYKEMLSAFDKDRETLKQGLYETREDMRKKVEGLYLMLISNEKN